MADLTRPYTVTALTRMIKATLQNVFPDVWVEGEISDYKLHAASGHRYFSLKDENATIRMVMWRSTGAQVKFQMESGLKVRIHGELTLYEKTGNYQIQVQQITPIGVGPLELAFRQLYDKLKAEGHFEPERKRPIPQYPMCVGVVTSASGAVIRDIINISRKRNPSAQLVLYPAAVQGEGAEKTIAAGITYLNTRSDIDVIIIGRGGGSLEDLWCFNTETVVRAVTASRIPVVSAVGHEVDTTLSDYAADLRASTPSHAAELVIWSRKEFADLVRSHIYTQTGALRNFVSQARQELAGHLRRPAFERPYDMIQQRQQYADGLVRVLMATGKNRFDRTKNALSLLASRLDDLSPLKILARGYSVTRRASDQAVIRQYDEVKVGEEIETRLASGVLISRVEKTSDR